MNFPTQRLISAQVVVWNDCTGMCVRPDVVSSYTRLGFGTLATSECFAHLACYEDQAAALGDGYFRGIVNYFPWEGGRIVNYNDPTTRVAPAPA